MALSEDRYLDGTEDTDPLAQTFSDGTEDTGPLDQTFSDAEPLAAEPSALDAFARKEYEEAKAGFTSSTADILNRIKKARETLLAKPTTQSRSEYVQGLAQALSPSTDPRDPRFFERQNLHTFLRDVGRYGASQRAAQKTAEEKKQEELMRLDELASKYGQDAALKRMQLSSQLMGRTRPVVARPTSASDNLTADERNALAMGMPLKDYLEYRNELIAGRRPPPAPPRPTAEQSKVDIRNQAMDVLNNPNASAADKQKAQATIDSLTPPDVRKANQAEKTKAMSFLERAKNQQVFTVPDLNSAIKQIDEGGQFAAGNLSKWLEGLPWIGQAATDLERTLDSIRSKLGFDKLEELKKLSPYGASGLGAVSNAEQKLLQSVKGSIERDQSPPNLKRNLERIRDFYLEQMPDLLRSAGIEDIDVELRKLRGQAEPGAAASAPPAAAPRIDLDAIRKERERREKAKRESGGV